MADIKAIFKQIADSLKKKKLATKTVTSAKPGQRAAQPMIKSSSATTKNPTIHSGNAAKPATSAVKKPFDIKIYWIAVQDASRKFFKEQIPYFFKNIKPVMKKAPDWWKKQKQDEQIAYISWAVGHLLMLVGIILIIIL